MGHGEHPLFPNAEYLPTGQGATEVPPPVSAADARLPAVDQFAPESLEYMIPSVLPDVVTKFDKSELPKIKFH